MGRVPCATQHGWKIDLSRTIQDIARSLQPRFSHVQGLVANIGVRGDLDVAPSQEHAGQADAQKADDGQHDDDENRSSLSVPAADEIARRGAAGATTTGPR